MSSDSNLPASVRRARETIIEIEGLPPQQQFHVIKSRAKEFTNDNDREAFESTVYVGVIEGVRVSDDPVPSWFGYLYHENIAPLILGLIVLIILSFSDFASPETATITAVAVVVISRLAIMTRKRRWFMRTIFLSWSGVGILLLTLPSISGHLTTENLQINVGSAAGSSAWFIWVVGILIAAFFAHDEYRGNAKG